MSLIGAIYFSLCLAKASPLGISATEANEQPAAGRSFELFPRDFDTKKQTFSLKSRNVTIGAHVFQVFFGKDSNRELFRVDLGPSESPWWRYGIVFEADINSDGRPDYCWYGGDDTSDIRYCFISQSNGSYSKIDVYATIRHVWSMKFPKEKPLEDLDRVDGKSHLDRLLALKEDHGLKLEADLELFDDSHSLRERRTLYIRESDLVRSRDKHP